MQNEHTHMPLSKSAFTHWRDLLVLEWTVNRKRILLSAALVLGLMLVVVLFATKVTSEEYVSPWFNGDDPMWRNEIIIYTIFLFVGGAVAGARCFHNYNDREGRLATITLPATAFEKLCVWLAIYVVGWIAVTFVSIILCDLIRVGCLRAFEDVGSQVKVLPVRNILAFSPYLDKWRPSDACQAATLWSLVLGTQAVFALGAIYSPRLSVLKTYLVLQVLGIVLIAVGALGIKVWFGNEKLSGIYEGIATWGDAVWMVVAGVVGLCLMYWLAWARMRQTEVVIKW